MAQINLFLLCNIHLLPHQPHSFHMLYCQSFTNFGILKLYFRTYRLYVTNSCPLGIRPVFVPTYYGLVRCVCVRVDICVCVNVCVCVYTCFTRHCFCVFDSILIVDIRLKYWSPRFSIFLTIRISNYLECNLKIPNYIFLNFHVFSTHKRGTYIFQENKKD